MAAPVLIFGAGGHAKVVAAIARSLGRTVVGFIEDGDARDGVPFQGAHVIAWEQFAGNPDVWPDAEVALAVGDNRGREHSLVRVRQLRRAIATLVHPSAVLAPDVQLGQGTVIMPLAVINPDVTVGEGAIINTGALVEHDCRVGDFVHLSPRVVLGGGVVIGARAHLGLGAVALPKATIGPDARVGAGAVVLREVAAGATVVGVPARAIPLAHSDSARGVDLE